MEKAVNRRYWEKGTGRGSGTKWQDRGIPRSMGAWENKLREGSGLGLGCVVRDSQV